jgi:hypothetical protein
MTHSLSWYLATDQIIFFRPQRPVLLYRHIPRFPTKPVSRPFIVEGLETRLTFVAADTARVPRALCKSGEGRSFG